MEASNKRKAAGEATVEEGHSGKQAKGDTGPLVGGRSKHHTSPEFLVTLLHTRAEELRPPQNTVFVAERTDKIVDVFKGLVKHNFLSVPVLQRTGRKWYGFLDMGDIVSYVCDTFGSTQLSTTQDFWTLFNKEEAFREVTVKDVMRAPLTRRNPFHPVKGGYSLLYAVEALAKERNLYRVAVVDDDRQLLNLITDSQVLNFLYENIDKIGPKVDKPVSDMNVLKEVISIKESQPAIDAFNLMVKEAISGVAVVDDMGHLVGNLSVRDLKVMAPDGGLFWRVYGSAKNFLDKLHTEYAGSGRPATIQTCTVNDTLKTVITKLAANRIHRLFVVNDRNIPIGVVSLRDVLVEILSR